MTESKYWSKMLIADNTSENQNNNNYIISKENPGFDNVINGKNVKLSYDIEENEYDEVCDFYKKYNVMVSGNVTLMPKSGLKRYLSFDNISILMRNSNGKLMGVIISIIVPILIDNRIINHGCTTFLVIHPSIRKYGMCMILIQALAQKGYEMGIYCSYQTTHIKIGSNNVPIVSYFKPINLNRSVELGFFYPDFFDPRQKTRNRLWYNPKLPKKSKFVKIDIKNLGKSLQYYRESIDNKKFCFCPDKFIWEKWISNFPTYLIYNDNRISGIVSFNTIHCFMKESKKEGKLGVPIICNGKMNLMNPVLYHIAYKEGYDVLYGYNIGDLSSEMEKYHWIKTDNPVNFSLYNNSINLTKDDISVPIL